MASVIFMPLAYYHLDVFTPHPYSGNSIVVFPDSAGLSSDQMARITRELRHFEAIFLTPDGEAHCYQGRVFDLHGELDFAGHPLLGAACAMHETEGRRLASKRWTLRLPARTVDVYTQWRGTAWYGAVLDQGPAEFLQAAGPRPDRAELASWFSLSEGDLDPMLHPEVVSTGLRYLILPVRSDALVRARIAVMDLDAKLAGLGAQYAYLLDAVKPEGRHWNNDGLVEDVATGSAAGCVAAYLRRHGVFNDGRTAVLRQGRFTGRPSEMTIRAYGTGTAITSVEVGGDVVVVGCGQLGALP